MPPSLFSQFTRNALTLPLIILLGCSSDPTPARDGSATGGRGGSGGSGGSGGGTGGTGGTPGTGGTGGTGGSVGRDAARTPDGRRPDGRAPDGRGPDGRAGDGRAPDVATGAFVVTAPWANGGTIAAMHGCAMNLWPAISWTAGPAGTASYAFALHDNDYQTHYVIYNLPPTTRSLPPVPAGTGLVRQTFATVNNTVWGGPCPPTGSHRYTVTVYALNTATYAGPTNTAPAARDYLQLAGTAAVIGRASIDGNYQQ